MMNILLVTNTFTPHVGGVARSVVAFAREYRQRGHRVLVLAPRFPNMPAREQTQRGVTTPVSIVPTGVSLESLAEAGESAITPVNSKDPKQGGQIAP
jgi:hypothetical protein